MKNIKRLKMKIISIILLVTLLTLEFSPFAVKATANQLQFYSKGAVSVGYDSYNGKNVFYGNATLGGVTAYCIDYTCGLPSGTMTFRDYLSDQGMAVLIHGYPNCTAASLGCANDEEAYMATQMALWEVLNRTGESKKAGLIFRVENVTPKSGMEGFYSRSVAAAKKLVAMAEADPYTDVPTLVVNTQSATSKELGSDILMGPYTVRIDGASKSNIKSIKAMLENAPSSARITDANGNDKTSVGNGDSIYVRMSASEESTSFKVKFTADVDRKVGCIYTQAGYVQDYVRLDTVPNNMEQSVTINWTKTENFGRIELIKVDQDDQPVVGAKFRLEQADGTLIGDVSTGTDGKITFYNVPVGDYVLTELEAPEGYVIKEKTTNVTVKAGEISTVKVKNERITGKIVVTKIDDANKPLANVKFNLYDSEGYYITSMVTGEDGKASIDVEYGTYYFKEVEAPAGYIMDETMYKFSVTEENRTFYQTVTNERYKGTLLIVKTDEEETPIQGVKFNILDSQGNVVKTIVTDENGLAGVKNIPIGTYYYQEIEAPGNFVIDNQKYEFKIESNNQIIRKDIVNEKIKGSLKIIKVDEENKAISGVKFDILDANKNVIETITTDENGIATSSKLEKGTYYYKENSVPGDYIIDSKEYEFKIESNNQVIEKTVVNYQARGSLKVIKFNNAGENISNVKFNILDANKNVVDTIVTNKNGVAISKKLPLGQYYYQEVEAPDNVVMDTTIRSFVLTSNNQVITKNIVNKLVDGKLKIIKVDENNKPLEGVKFNILDANKNVIDTIVTDKNGVAESKELEKGTYYFQEIEAPEGIIVDDTIYEFKIEYDGQNVIKNIVNNYAKGNIVITKYDSTGKLLQNVKFQILDEAKQVVDTIVTDEKGVATSKKLILGKYFYREIEAPDNVIMDTEIHEFSLTENNQVVSKTVVNELIEGKLKIIKVDENDKPLEGVKFNILDANKKVIDTIVTDVNGVAVSKELEKGKYYYQEIEAPEGIIVDNTMYEFEVETDGQNVIKNMVNYYEKGTLVIKKYDSNNNVLSNVKFDILDENGNVVDTIVTDEKGVATSKKLIVGTYYYMEVEAPENVVIDKNKYEFSLTENNQVITKEVVNELIEGKLKIIKVDENNKPLQGVKFNILDLNKNVIDTIVTDENGIAESKELEKGKYYYQEIEAPEGIIVDNTMYEFEVETDGQNVIKNMVNYYAKGSLLIKKYDSKNRALSNVKFNILDENGNVVDTIVTDENGIATSKKLILGTYYYMEVEAPENVVIDTNKYEFGLTENNQVITKTVINELVEGKLKIIKVDENNEPLQGVKFNILDENKKVIDTIVTDENGVAESKEIEKGKYYYQEIEAPEGIIVDNTMYEFEVEEDGQNVIKNMINYYIKGTLQITKLVEGTDEVLAGVKFAVLDEERNIVDTIVTDENGIATSKKLPYGTYYFKEIEVPEGYIMDNREYNFNISENDEIVQAVVYNKKAELPVTGGLVSSDATIVLIVSMVAIFGYAVMKFLSDKNEEIY
ncbi:MAG: Cys-Gln thioester bond-forming surface protein [Clostridia bacterium]|nr:Cys-Gln thioester bond-forming surface protein [Clostridia bacterium]